MTAATTPFAIDPRLLPAAHISPEHYRGLAAYIEAAAPKHRQSTTDRFGVLIAAVRPYALATLAALVDHDQPAIAILDEAQFQGRCVALTPRPDWGYSLTVAAVGDGCSQAAGRPGPGDTTGVAASYG